MRQISTFVPRLDLGKEILKGLGSDPSPFSSLQRLCMVHGLGGAGKSQLVLHYVEQTRTRYSGIFWIDAASTDSIGRDFEHLHDLMYPDEKGKGPKRSSFDELFRAIGGWFSGRSERFLLVFDGADNIDEPKDPSNVDLRKVVPNHISLDVIVTTRRSSAQGFGSFSLEVSEMEEEEALQLLRNSSGLDPQQLRPSEVEEMRKIIRELGSFALAIQLTGSYISQTPRILTDLSRYLPEYRKRRKQLLDNTPGLADQYTMSVISSWEVSFESLSRLSIIAANLLSFLAFIDSTDIFESWFEPFFNLMHCDLNHNVYEEGRRCQSVLSPAGPFTYYDLEQGFKTLRAFSFIRRMTTGPGYSIHKLVHAWGFDRLGHQKKLDLIRVTMMFFSCHLSVFRPLYVERRQVAKHAMVTFNVISSIDLRTDRNYVCSRLRKVFVPFFHELEDWSSKHKLQLFISDCVQNSLGRDHIDSLLIRQEIVETLWRQIKHPEAVALQEEVVEKFAMLCPTQSCGYLEAMGSLVDVLRKSGRFEDAERVSKTVLEEKDRLYGEGRLSRTTSDELELHLEKTLGKGVQVALETALNLIDMGEQFDYAEHPVTLRVGECLASIMENQGFLGAAETVLDGVTHCLEGTDGTHDVGQDRAALLFSSGSSLVKIRALRGHLGDEDLLRIALRIQTIFYGLEHSTTMRTFENLIQHLRLQNKMDEIVRMLKGAAKDMTPGKRQTLTIVDQLAFLLLTQKVDCEAEEIFRELLEKFTRTLGAENISTVYVSERLAVVAQATQLYNELEAQKRQVGANNPTLLEMEKAMMTEFISPDEEINDYLGLPSALERDAEERRWNDEKSRGWDDEVHRRLVSTIAKYEGKARRALTDAETDSDQEDNIIEQAQDKRRQDLEGEQRSFEDTLKELSCVRAKRRRLASD